MYKKHQIGKVGELAAVKYLTQNNYEIIETNYLCKQGEIDIIAKEKNELIFVEVKTRTNLKYGMPVDAVDQRKQKHIYNAVDYYIHSKNLQNVFVRIDIIQVYIRKNSIKINHIKQVF